MPRDFRLHARHGFTVVELLVATVAGVLLMVALANVAQIFSSEVQALRVESDRSLEETLSVITHDVRHGWVVEQLSDERLDVVDPYGNRTTYELEDSQLVVIRPDGTRGALLSGVADLDITTTTRQRLRDDTPLELDSTWWDVAEPSGTPDALILDDSETLALGFTVTAETPEGIDTVDDIEEGRMATTLDGIVMPLEYIHDPGPPTPIPGSNVLVVQAYQARGYGDSRPIGAPLATMTTPINLLPEATVTSPGTTIYNAQAHKVSFPCNMNSVFTCHIPPGSPHQRETLCVGGPALLDHVEHGDCPRPCDMCDEWPDPVAHTPTGSAPLDLQDLGLELTPGAYTLTITVVGTESLVVRSVSVAAPEDSNLALHTLENGQLTPVALGVLHQFDGLERFTQTVEHQVVDSAKVVITLEDGRTLEGTALVTGQQQAEDPWLGSVPDEFQALRKADH